MPLQPHSKVHVFDTPEDVARAAAERFVVLVDECLQSKSYFSVALAGGNTPRRLYELLATDAFKHEIEWARVHIFFGDERAVPHDHPDSNFRMAHEALLSKISIPSENVHPMNGAGDVVENARDYERDLKKFFSGVGWPRLDLVLLGLGKDAHTASLFPGSSALNETRSWVASNWVEGLNVYRLTLTAPSINAAANVEFLVTGSDKAAALAAVIDGPFDPKRFPAQIIQPRDGNLIWLVDEAAHSSVE
jgi:6-phosphogluconolactonase